VKLNETKKAKIQIMQKHGCSLANTLFVKGKWKTHIVQKRKATPMHDYLVVNNHFERFT
jgi:hypothetical protein